MWLEVRRRRRSRTLRLLLAVTWVLRVRVVKEVVERVDRVERFLLRQVYWDTVCADIDRWHDCGDAGKREGGMVEIHNGLRCIL